MKSNELCLSCGHLKEAHTCRVGDWPTKLDSICWDCDDGCWDKYHEFKLDNLKLIEDVAKAKGLI